MTHDESAASVASGSHDLRELARTRALWAAAESRGDADVFESLLADDVVILPPGPPAVEGKAACMAFIRGVLSDMAAEFDREIVLTSAEVAVEGAWAYDRGAFSQRLVRRETGEVIQESGKYFWLYRRVGGAWKLARIVGSYDWGADEESVEGG